MRKLKLTIIIPCSTDIRIGKCIESIDEKVEVVVVLNGPSNEVRRILKNKAVKIVNLKDANLSNALNYGIRKATYTKVLFMDSDCRFQRGAIKKIYSALQNNLIVKGKIVFEYNNFTSKIIAKVRDYVNNNKPKPYNPFLAFDKEIKKYTYDYYFDSRIHWTEDADFYSRLKKSEVKVKYVLSAKVYHPPLAPFQDLRSAFRYGIGKRIRVEKKISRGIGSHFSNIPNLIVKKGMYPGIYYFIWNISYFLGYLFQIVADPYKPKNK